MGLALGNTDDKRKRKLYLLLSIFTNLGILGFFKYYNFFVGSWIDAWAAFGVTMQSSTLNIILPVGISFYTFQSLSYSIDVYRRKLEPEKNFAAFAAYVSFFPQLVAGPIERARNFLPQFTKTRSFNYALAVTGCKLILWGLFKKVVIADTFAPYVNDIFASHETQTGLTLFLGAFFFALQIYGDFSGYTDIARGLARLFGFELMKNFDYPYFSRDISEFWRRWHISLSTWFRDYLYFPLGGSRGGTLLTLRNVFAIFLVSGFWHGANWTFVLWGGLNALYFVPLYLLNLNRKNLDEISTEKTFPSLREFMGISITFILTCIAWVFFRAENVSHAFEYLGRMFTTFDMGFLYYINLALAGVAFLVLEWYSRYREYNKILDFKHRGLRYFMYFTLTFLVLAFSQVNLSKEFIYFQF